MLFAHSSTLVPFYTALKISENKEDFNLSDIGTENKNRVFTTPDLDPMNSNIAFVVYKANFKGPYDSKFPRYYLKIFRNEKAISIAACGYEKNCDLKKFINYYKNFVDSCGSTRKICKLY